jgi:hypothetical protein
MMIKKLVTVTAFVMLFAFLSTSITFNVVSASEGSACSGSGVSSCSDDEFEKFLGTLRRNSLPIRLKLCQSRSEVAGVLMENRQDDGLMSDEINFWLENQNIESERILSVIRLAWEEPVWQTSENQQRAINGFKNKIYTECFDEVTAEEK